MRYLIVIFTLLFAEILLGQAKPFQPSSENFWSYGSNSSSFTLEGVDELYGYSLLNENNYQLNLAPVVDAQFASFEGGQYSFFGGAQIEAKLGQKLFFNFALLGGENQADSILENYNYKVLSSSPYRMSFQRNYDINAVMSYSPNSVFNLQAGIGKIQLGNGDRSLLLGNYGRNYPYAALSTNIWKFKLLNLYQFFKEDVNGRSVNKYASTHYLSIDLTPKIELSLFETVVFQPKDTTLNRGYELEYLNPFILFRPVEYGLGSSDNIMIGLNLNYKFHRRHMVYSQFILDDGAVPELVNRTRWWANKYAFQLGVKGSFLNSKLKYLSELNVVRPFTYSHLNALQNYSNRGMVLAHPAGANFIESFTRLHYDMNEYWRLNFSFQHMLRGGENETPELSYGTDPYLPYNNRDKEYGYTIANGGALRRTRLSLGAEYVLNKKLDLRVYANMLYLRDRIEFQNEESYGVHVGLKTNLWKTNSFKY